MNPLELHDNKIVRLAAEFFEGLEFMISSATKIVCNSVDRVLREHILFAYRTNFNADFEKNLLWLFGVTAENVRQYEIGNCMKCFLPPLLPAVSKIQVQTVRRSVDRSQCFGGHQVSKAASLMSLL